MNDPLWILASLLVLFASILFMGSLIGNPALPAPNAAAVAQGAPRGVFAITRHPMMWGFALWALAHALVMPTQGQIVLSASIAFLALVGSAGQGANHLAYIKIGTGIGCAMFIDGVLVPNLELGHIEIRGKDAETRASASARERRGQSFAEWAPALSEYLNRIDQLIWPDLIILGGGISRKAGKFIPLLDVRPPVVAAALQNQAGIVGAASRAREILAPPVPRRTPARPAPRRASAARTTPAGSGR